MAENLKQHSGDLPRAIHIPTFEEAREILGGRLPRILRETEFRNGLALVDGRPMVPAYVAGPQGFNDLLLFARDNMVYPGLRAAGILPLDPFDACSEFLDKEAVFDRSKTVEGNYAAWNKFDRMVVEAVNYGLLMPSSLLVIALAEGPHADEGMSTELMYAQQLGLPVIAVRSDIRSGENPGSPTNPAVDDLVPEGQYFTAPGAYVRLFSALAKYTPKMIERQLSMVGK